MIRPFFGIGQPKRGPADKISVRPTITLSLRRMSYRYKGPVVRVRRSTDDAEMNIGTTADGHFDVATFSAFVGAGNGFVTIFYDQSGFGHNFAQATASLQFQIVLTSSLTTRAHLSAGTFSGGYQTTGVTFSNSNFTGSAIIRSDSTFAGAVITSAVQTPNPYTYFLFIETGRMYWGNGAGPNSPLMLSPATMQNVNLVIAGRGLPSTVRTLWSKGVLNATGGNAQVADFQPQIGGGTSNIRGNLAEVIMWGSGIPDADITNIHQNQMLYYGIS